ncbi:MAG: PAS domain-containing protein [Bacteroidales bacterium]
MTLAPSGPGDLENRLAFEMLVSDISARLAAAPDQAIASTIEEALEETARLLGADRGRLFSVDAPQSEVRVLHAWYAGTVESSDRGVPASSLAEHTPWTADLIVTKRQPLVIGALDELPPEAQRDRASFVASGVRSVLWVPVAVGPDLLFVLSVEATHGEVHWPHWLPHRLLRLGEIFGHTVERQRVADALRETNARIALATSSADAGPWDLDLSTGRIWATPAARTLYGFADNAEVTFEAFLSVVHPDDIDRVRERVSQTAATGSDFVDEYRVVLPGSTVRWVAVRGRARMAIDGSGPHVFGMSVDVTARKLAEAEHRANIARLEAAVDAAGLGFYLMSPPGETALLDERTRDLFGISPDQEPRLRTFWLEHIHPDDRDQVIQASRNVHGGRVDRVSRVYRYQHPTRGLVWYQHTTRTFERDSSGRPTRVAGVLQDITEQKRIEWEIREREARLEAAAELAGLGFYEIDFVEGRVFVDQRFRDLTGIPPEPLQDLLIVDYWIEHVHPDDRPRLFDLRRKMHAEGLDRGSIEYRFLHPSRGERWVQHVSTVVGRDSSSGAIRTFGILRDITERKRAEEELSTLSRRLIRAQEAERALLARELHDDVTQRMAVLAIELGRAESSAPAGVQSETLRAVREGLVRLSEDIHSLAYQLHPAVLEELGLAEALRTECERKGRHGGVAVTLHLDPAPAAVGKDATLCLYRVAQEALNNVVRHARAQTASVTLRQVDGGLVLAVRDDGAGFNPGEPGNRGSLGLVSMRERLRLVNGTLDIDSAPGQGTVVLAWVPGEGDPQ